jgi:hypothetical protein
MFGFVRKIKGAGAQHLIIMEEVTELRIRTPPPDEVMEDRHRRRKQPCATRLFSRIESCIRVGSLVFAGSVLMTVLVVGWARIYAECC